MILISTSKVILFFVKVKLLWATILDNKLAVCKFYLTVDRFFARVQIPTLTTYEKCLRESIMAVLTPKSGMKTILSSVSPPNPI